MKRTAGLCVLLFGCGDARLLSSEAIAMPKIELREVQPTRERTLTVVSYNVNYGLSMCSRGQCSADAETLDVLDKLDADLVLLQETNEAWEKALVPRMKSRFGHATFHDPTTTLPSGLGAFSKFPIEADEVLASPLGWFPANRMVVRTPDGPVEVLNVHLRPAIGENGSWVTGFFTTGPLRHREMVTYTPHLDPKLPTIVAGDFNENEEGDAFADLVKLGFQSALPEKAKDATTWRWVAYGLPLALRLDHVAYERAAFEVVSADVVQGGKSDHLPVRVVLRRRAL